MAAMATALIVLLVAAPAVLGETYTVGGDSGWDSGVDYGDWVSDKTFTVGDTLEFKFTATHSVNEVDEDGYTGCSSASIKKSYSNSPTTIDLDVAGPRYFICPTPGHCDSGMKLKINVIAAAPTTPTTPGTATPPPPSTPGTATPPPPSTPGSPTVNATSPPSGSGGSPPPPSSPNSAEGLSSVGVSVVLATLLLAYLA